MNFHLDANERERELKEVRELKELKEQSTEARKSNVHNSSFLSEKRILTNRENKESSNNAEKLEKGKHLLDAIFSLYKLLDETGLEIARNECNRMLTKFKH